MRAQGTNLRHVRTTLATFTANAAGSDFANGTGSGVCETCHTTTKYYNNTGTGAAHETGVCTTCHTHQAGMVPPTDYADAPHDVITDCSLCHDPGTYVIGATIANTKCLGCHDGSQATQVDTHHGDVGTSFPSMSKNCIDCHNPMRTQGTNAFHVRTTLATFTGSDFVHGAPNYDGICETCHTLTQQYRNNASSPVTDHNVGSTCTNCHTHNGAFLGVGGTPPPPHDTQACNTCHTGASYTDPIVDSACLSCHDETAPGSGNLNQVDDFTALTTGAAGRPVFGNWTGLAGSDTTNGWMVWTGATSSAGTGPTDGNPTEYVVLESSPSTGGCQAEVTLLDSWTNNGGGSDTHNHTVSGTSADNRVLVVAYTGELNATWTPTFSNPTYGGSSMSLVVGSTSASGTTRRQSFLFICDETCLAGADGSGNIVIGPNPAPTAADEYVFAATYSGIDQTTPYINLAGDGYDYGGDANNGTNQTPAENGGVIVRTGDRYIYTIVNSTPTTTVTAASGFTNAFSTTTSSARHTVGYKNDTVAATVTVPFTIANDRTGTVAMAGLVLWLWH